MSREQGGVRGEGRKEVKAKLTGWGGRREGGQGLLVLAFRLKGSAVGSG